MMVIPVVSPATTIACQLSTQNIIRARPNITIITYRITIQFNWCQRPPLLKNFIQQRTPHEFKLARNKARFISMKPFHSPVINQRLNHHIVPPLLHQLLVNTTRKPPRYNRPQWLHTTPTIIKNTMMCIK